jgi:hypothetical protein
MIVLMLAFLGVFPVQSAPAAAEGTWVADHQGTTFVRLELRTVNNALTGGIATGNVSVGDNGEVVKVTPVPAALTPLTDLTVNGAVVSFFRLEGDDTEHFRLNVLSVDQAELAFLPSEELLLELKEAGIAIPKPIRLRKLR